MKSKLNVSHCQDLQEVLQRASSFLNDHGVEANAAKWLLREKYERRPIDLALNRHMLSKEELQAFSEDIVKVSQHYPVQYVVGHTWFYGRSYKVSEDVLIPRPETEEWVDRVLKECDSRKSRVLDIGTGSGVIALTLALERPDWLVTAVDISPQALQVARFNAQRLGADLELLESNLTDRLGGRTFDLIVCNPPYISQEERQVMGQSVRDYEPNQALFADQKGLAIYHQLAECLPSCLSQQGRVYLEIGYRQGPAVKSIMEEAFADKTIEIIEDMNGLDRLVRIASV